MAITVKEQAQSGVSTPTTGNASLFIDTADEKLKKKLSDGTVQEILQTGSVAVSSVFGRTGAVVAVAGDYTGSLVTNVPAGDIVATTVQAAINELDTEKAPITHVGSGGVTQHAIATGAAAGFMSPSDFTKLGGIATGATNTPLSNSAPNDVGATNPGVSTSASRDDHVHAHGSQIGGSLHAQVTTSVDGFMIASDKLKLDGVQAGATANQTDAYLLSRANQTGTQLASTISDFTTAAQTAILTTTITDGDTTHAPNGNVVYDTLNNSAFIATSNVVSTSSTSYSILTSDFMVILSSSSAVTVQLPNPATARQFIIKDSSGVRETNQISLVRFASESIDGLAATRLLSTNYGAWRVVSNGANWFLA